MKQGDTKKALTNELHRVEEEIKRHYANQRAEDIRLQQQVTGLKNDKTSLEKDIIRMQKRIDELELQIGHDEENGHKWKMIQRVIAADTQGLSYNL